MFNEINSNREIGKILSGLNQDALIGIITSGPILGILKINCYVKRNGKTPIQSAVSSRILQFSFYCWNKIQDHLNIYFNDNNYLNGVKNVEEYKQNIIEFSKDNESLFCITVPLFIESQMRVFSKSPYPAQEIVTKLIEPIFKNEEIFDDYERPGFFENENAVIYITLHAGQRPFVQVNFPQKTIQSWSSYLEAICVFSIPQMTKLAIENVNPTLKVFLKEIIQNQFNIWEKNPAIVGGKSNWSWLPYLISD